MLLHQEGEVPDFWNDDTDLRGACNQLVEHSMYKAIIISMCIVAGKRHYKLKLVLKLMAHTHKHTHIMLSLLGYKYLIICPVQLHLLGNRPSDETDIIT